MRSRHLEGECEQVAMRGAPLLRHDSRLLGFDLYRPQIPQITRIKAERRKLESTRHKAEGRKRISYFGVVFCDFVDRLSAHDKRIHETHETTLIRLLPTTYWGDSLLLCAFCFLL